jgi:hypothetical protein
MVIPHAHRPHYPMGRYTRDSKLVSGFPLPIIFKSGKNKKKLLMEYESVTQEVFFSKSNKTF